MAQETNEPKQLEKIETTLSKAELYIENNQKWILFCYPGNPLKNTVYLYQLDPFKLDWKENPYQNSFYNLEDKKLIDYSRVDLDSYQVIQIKKPLP